MKTRNQGTIGTEIGRIEYESKLFDGDMSTEIPSEDETVLELNQFHLSPEVMRAFQSLSIKMECLPEETLEMSLREYFLSTQNSEMD